VINSVNPLLITIINPATWIKNPQVTSSMYKIKITITETDHLGRMSLYLKKKKYFLPEIEPTHNCNLRGNYDPMKDPKIVQVIKIKDLNKPLKIETGYGKTNARLK
jgi:hypothetical protein